MSKSDTTTDRRTEHRTNAPDTRQLASELGVDARLMTDFVAHHPRPTAAIVLGWARTNGHLRIHPEKLKPDVEAWLDARPEPTTDDVDLEDRLRADSLRAIVGGESNE